MVISAIFLYFLLSDNDKKLSSIDLNHYKDAVEKIDPNMELVSSEFSPLVKSGVGYFDIKKIDAETIYFQGGINDAAYKKLKNLKFKNLIIKSYGGDVDSSIDLANKIHNEKINVIIFNYCVSACAQYIALAANNLYVKNNSFLYFHSGPVLVSHEMRAKFNPSQKIAIDRLITKHKAFYKQIGINSQLDNCFRDVKISNKANHKDDIENKGYNWNSNNVDDLVIYSGHKLVAVEKRTLEYYGLRNIIEYNLPDDFEKNFDGFRYKSTKYPIGEHPILIYPYCYVNFNIMDNF